ncbi:hypothetical protein [Synechococcus sp. MIT S1220]|uniref:hypothetical protein n=1 Tax=Synechococcus sp. MIT S1220 TaxID=3082549 RepID=UPI0039B02F96
MHTPSPESPDQLMSCVKGACDVGHRDQNPFHRRSFHDPHYPKVVRYPASQSSAGRAPAWHAGGQVRTVDSPAPG